MNDSTDNMEVMNAYVMNEVMGEMRYTLTKRSVDGREAFSISVLQVTPSGDVNYKMADDVCCDEDSATALFRTISEGEVEPCVLYDVLYDLLP